MKKLLFALVIAAAACGVASADPAVSAAQQKLKKLGYYSGPVDGEYGSQTGAAIRRYQLAEDLKVTGELNPQTLASLGIATKSPAGKRPTAETAPEFVAIADIFKGGPFISAPTDLQIESIRQAQKNLKLLGYYSGPIDGRPTASLVSGLKAWQQSAGFRQTGRFDENTLKGLDIMPN